MICPPARLLAIGATIVAVLGVGAAPLQAQQPPGPRFSVGALAGFAFFRDAALGTLPMLGLRGEWHYAEDFNAFGEVTQGWVGGSVPGGCVIDACVEHLDGGRIVRTWHMGLETRLLERALQYRLSAYAGLGQIAVQEPRPAASDRRIVYAEGSLLVGLANRWSVGENMAVRVSGAASLRYANDVSGIEGVRETLVILVGVTRDFGGRR